MAQGGGEMLPLPQTDNSDQTRIAHISFFHPFLIPLNPLSDGGHDVIF